MQILWGRYVPTSKPDSSIAKGLGIEIQLGSKLFHRNYGRQVNNLGLNPKHPKLNPVSTIGTHNCGLHNLIMVMWMQYDITIFAKFHENHALV